MAYVFGSIWDRINRNALNNLSKIVEQQGISIQDLVAKGQLTPSQYATLIQTINGLVSKGNVTFDDIDINQGKLLPKHLSEEVLKMLTGDAPINAVPADGSLTTEKYADKSVNENKVTFFGASSKNLFDPYKLTVGKSISTTTGELINFASHKTSDFIRVLPNTDYKSNVNLGTIGFYDINKNFLSFKSQQLSTGYMTTPPNTAYVRFSLAITTDEKVLQFQQGQFSTSFEKHRVLNTEYLSDSSLSGDKLKEDSISPGKTTFLKASLTPNVFDKTKVSRGLVSSSDGTINTAYSTYSVSDYIPVEAGEIYKSTSKSDGAMYDASKVYVSGLQGHNGEFIVPSGVNFVRLTFSNDDLDTGMIAKDELPSRYTPYGYHGLELSDNFKQAIEKMLPNDSPGHRNTSIWEGKRWVTLGDSITWQDGKPYGSGNTARGYQTVINEKLNFSAVYNHGVSGAPMANGTANGDGTNATGKSVVYTNIDLVTIAAGTNDFKLNVPIGSLGEIGDSTFDVNTFIGAYRDLIEYILSNKPAIRIALWTPLQRDNGGYNVNNENTAGHKLKDYVKAIEDIGTMYGIPVCDMYANSGFTKKTLATFTRDGLHPNDVGYERMATYGGKFLELIGT